MKGVIWWIFDIVCASIHFDILHSVFVIRHFFSSQSQNNIECRTPNVEGELAGRVLAPTFFVVPSFPGSVRV